MKGINEALNGALSKWGLKLTRLPQIAGDGPYSALFNHRQTPDLDRLARSASRIPGMLSEETGKLLFALCYMQQIEGDVVEIGSWQGYSTSFLARAVAERGGPGRMFAVDHFRGNAGKESFYAAGKSDLSDLESNFRRNMQSLGLDESVTLLAMPNAQAVEKLRSEHASVRFLFIDGDHSKKGVQTDVDLFFPLLKKHSIVVFDDCSADAPGVIEVIDELFRKNVCERAFAYSNTLVAML
jgi:predicted O-methyltransferase YrrM